MAGFRPANGKLHAAQSAGQRQLEAARRKKAADDPQAASSAEAVTSKSAADPQKAKRVGVIDYADVAALRKFISERGNTRTRRITGVSVQEQRLLAHAVKNAREMVLLRDAGAGRIELEDVVVDGDGDVEVEAPGPTAARGQKIGPDALDTIRTAIGAEETISLSTSQHELVTLSGEEAELIAKVLEKVREPRPALKMSPREILDRVSAAIPEEGPSPWDELIGPFYSTSSLAVLRGVSRQALQKMRDGDKLLSVSTSDRQILYPVFQFDDAGEPVAHLGDVLSVLGDVIADGWTRALWFTGPVESWGGRSAIQKLWSAEPKDIEDVLVAAREAVTVRGHAGTER